ncbi:hypothetical protein [Flavobacterium branchiicola]|uniref:Uncharacterized protein n=1 Tax=Flavobacterium branchiicola TaxID=1114875 RepID=A0ABV9PIW4_9FLAO|nr:hypothetical protein [Flavobacterium branchiicola]MBS7256017.1 hypothetical protein [Flavobacterium branchiicola]
MKTNNIDGLTIFEINVLIQQGGKFVKFPYLKGVVNKIKTSNVYFVRPEERPIKYALKHFFTNFTLSLRVFPLAPLYIIKSFYFLLRGGKDYTFTMLESLNKNNPTYNADAYDFYDLSCLQQV